MPKIHTAHDIAADPDLYARPVTLPGSRLMWECMGYSRTGRTVRFARLLPGSHANIYRLKQINRYVRPDTIVKIAKDTHT